PADAAYFHYTTNNTIEGTELRSLPNTSIPLVADMSSDIFSYETDFSRFSLIYAGAQKNMGAAGVNLVVVKKDILGKVNRKIPSMLDYQQHIANGSMLNTPPVFAVYVVLLTLRWLQANGGAAAMEKVNIQKSDLLYDTLDSLPIFTPTIAKEDRSRMNAVFVINDPQKEEAFQAVCKQEGIVGVKGHRSVGGFRASLYNALPLSHVQVLVDLMRDFAAKNG
ncbi:MAG: 3-phosphoserine/phosphohydroxythreonine transaminase, partial [Hymenobacter sp.]